MELKKIAASLAVAVATFSGAASAGPTPVLYNSDNPTGGTFTNFDWASNGTAFTQGFVPVGGNNFTLTYFADAGTIFGGTVVTPHMDGNATAVVAGSTYEYTVVATLNETVVGCAGTVCTFQVTGGNFNIYYDSNPATFADNTLGTGFGADPGALLQIAGTLSSPVTQSFNYAVGFNVTGVLGAITYTDTNTADASYILPPLTNSSTVTTLQIGAFVSATPAGGYNGGAFPATTPFDTVFQADGNTGFTVPEPGSLALLGLGAAGLGLSYRRKRAA